MPQSTPPKHPTTRRRPNRGPQVKMLEKPVRPKIPALPKSRTWSASTREWWKTIWSSAVSSEWLPCDRGALERLATLHDELGRRDLKGFELAHMLQVETNYGLTPRSRRMLNWFVVDGTLEVSRRPGSTKSNVRRLKAVDLSSVDEAPE